MGEAEGEELDIGEVGIEEADGEEVGGVGFSEDMTGKVEVSVMVVEARVEMIVVV